METKVRCAQLLVALMRRYPGIQIGVYFNDHTTQGVGTYRGWRIEFASKDVSDLRRCGVVPSGWNGEEWIRGISEFDGVSWHAHGVIDSSECRAVNFYIEEDPHTDSRGRGRGPVFDKTAAGPLTKRRQAEVMRMLRPFIRGTWKPPGEQSGEGVSHGE